MEFPPCRTYHSVYPKYQAGLYAQQFALDPQCENVHFVQNPQDQAECLGTKAICYDIKYGSRPVPGQSLRKQALMNQTLKRIAASRPQSKMDGNSYASSVPDGSSCCGNQRSPPINVPTAAKGHVNSWWI